MIPILCIRSLQNEAALTSSIFGKNNLKISASCVVVVVSKECKFPIVALEGLIADAHDKYIVALYRIPNREILSVV